MSATLDFRYDRLKELGFTDKEAKELSEARDHNGHPVRLYLIEAALEEGCSHRQAWRIYS